MHFVGSKIMNLTASYRGCFNVQLINESGCGFGARFGAGNAEILISVTYLHTETAFNML